MQTAEDSSRESLGIFQFLQKIFPFLTHHLVRKLGHFTEFSVLGILLSRTTVRGIDTLAPEKSPRASLLYGIPLGLGLLTASCDEWIQTGIPGRSGEIRDVLIDLSGVICGILLTALVRIIRLKKRLATPPPPQ